MHACATWGPRCSCADCSKQTPATSLLPHACVLLVKRPCRLHHAVPAHNQQAPIQAPTYPHISAPVAAGTAGMVCLPALLRSFPLPHKCMWPRRQGMITVGDTFAASSSRAVDACATLPHAQPKTYPAAAAIVFASPQPIRTTILWLYNPVYTHRDRAGHQARAVWPLHTPSRPLHWQTQINNTHTHTHLHSTHTRIHTFVANTPPALRVAK
jgi:hypothetical protein